jgi:hypothetical protein
VKSGMLGSFPSAVLSEKGMFFTNYGQDFSYKIRVISTVKRVEFVTDRLSYIILKVFGVISLY